MKHVSESPGRGWIANVLLGLAVVQDAKRRTLSVALLRPVFAQVMGQGWLEIWCIAGSYEVFHQEALPHIQRDLRLPVLVADQTMSATYSGEMLIGGYRRADQEEEEKYNQYMLPEAHTTERFIKEVEVEVGALIGHVGDAAGSAGVGVSEGPAGLNVGNLGVGAQPLPPNNQSSGGADADAGSKQDGPPLAVPAHQPSHLEAGGVLPRAASPSARGPGAFPPHPAAAPGGSPRPVASGPHAGSPAVDGRSTPVLTRSAAFLMGDVRDQPQADEPSPSAWYSANSGSKIAAGSVHSSRRQRSVSSMPVASEGRPQDVVGGDGTEQEKLDASTSETARAAMARLRSLGGAVQRKLDRLPLLLARSASILGGGGAQHEDQEAVGSGAGASSSGRLGAPSGAGAGVAEGRNRLQGRSGRNVSPSRRDSLPRFETPALEGVGGCGSGPKQRSTHSRGADLGCDSGPPGDPAARGISAAAAAVAGSRRRGGEQEGPEQELRSQGPAVVLEGSGATSPVPALRQDAQGAGGGAAAINPLLAVGGGPAATPDLMRRAASPSPATAKTAKLPVDFGQSASPRRDPKELAAGSGSDDDQRAPPSHSQLNSTGRSPRCIDAGDLMTAGDNIAMLRNNARASPAVAIAGDPDRPRRAASSAAATSVPAPAGPNPAAQRHAECTAPSCPILRAAADARGAAGVPHAAGRSEAAAAPAQGVNHSGRIDGVSGSDSHRSSRSAATGGSDRRSRGGARLSQMLNRMAPPSGAASIWRVAEDGCGKQGQEGGGGGGGVASGGVSDGSLASGGTRSGDGHGSQEPSTSGCGGHMAAYPTAATAAASVGTIRDGERKGPDTEVQSEGIAPPGVGSNDTPAPARRQRRRAARTGASTAAEGLPAARAPPMNARADQAPAATAPAVAEALAVAEAGPQAGPEAAEEEAPAEEASSRGATAGAHSESLEGHNQAEGGGTANDDGPSASGGTFIPPVRLPFSIHTVTPWVGDFINGSEDLPKESPMVFGFGNSKRKGSGMVDFADNMAAENMGAAGPGAGSTGAADAGGAGPGNAGPGGADVSAADLGAAGNATGRRFFDNITVDAQKRLSGLNNHLGEVVGGLPSGSKGFPESALLLYVEQLLAPLPGDTRGRVQKRSRNGAHVPAGQSKQTHLAALIGEVQAFMKTEASRPEVINAMAELLSDFHPEGYAGHTTGAAGVPAVAPPVLVFRIRKKPSKRGELPDHGVLLPSPVLTEYTRAMVRLLILQAIARDLSMQLV